MATRVLNLRESFRFAFQLHNMVLDSADDYDQFKKRWMAGRYANSHWSERQIREAYDQFRRDNLRAEVVREVKQTRAEQNGQMLGIFLAQWPRRIHIITIAALILAVLFPPIYIEAGGQTISMGLHYAFDRRLGRIDSTFLLCELVGIVAAAWFSQRAVKVS
jgi:hypothetical protein